MNANQPESWPSTSNTLWTLFDCAFAIVVPATCLFVMSILLNPFGPDTTDIEIRTTWWFAAAEVVLYCVWRASRRSRSARVSALYTGWLGAGSAVAAAIALALPFALAPAYERTASVWVMALLVCAIPTGTAIAFARGAHRAWRFARRDPSFSAPARASAAALAILVVGLFWPLTSKAAVAWSIARVDRGDSSALDEAAELLRHVPWADTSGLASEWQRRRTAGQDATAIDNLHERVTGHDVQSTLEGMSD